MRWSATVAESSPTSAVKPSAESTAALPRTKKPRQNTATMTMTETKNRIKRRFRARALRADAASCLLSPCLAIPIRPQAGYTLR